MSLYTILVPEKMGPGFPTKTNANGSNIASHSWKNDNRIDFEKWKIIDKENHGIGKTLESWHAKTTEDADNNSKPLTKH